MNFCTWILLLPLLMALSPMSIIFFPVATDKLYYSCNKLTIGKILSIKNVDSFQCNMELYLYDYDRNITIADLSCKDLIKCRGIKNNCNNATIALNHLNPDRCKLLVLEGGNSKYSNSYKSDIDLYTGSLISFISFCFIVIMINLSACFENRK